MICMGALCIVLGCFEGSLLRMYQAAAQECDFGKDDLYVVLFTDKDRFSGVITEDVIWMSL